jgi:hypothetical protein
VSGLIVSVSSRPDSERSSDEEAAARISVAGGLLVSSFGGFEGDSPNPKNDANVDGDAGGVSGTGFVSD